MVQTGRIVSRSTFLALVIFVLLHKFGSTECADDRASINVNTEGELLLYKIEQDPQGNIDTYGQLNEQDRQKFFSFDDKTTWPQKLKKLRDFEIATYVDVKLVGFDQDGEGAISLKEADFKRYFDVTEESPHIQVLNEEKTRMKSMNMKTQTFHQVVHARKSLGKNLLEEMNKNIVNDSSGPSIPYETIDSVLEKDYGEQSTTYTIYIINLKRPSLAQNMTYKYHAKGGLDKTVIPKPCGVGLRAHANKRFLWVDLNAGPFVYGPHIVGEGLVTFHDIPSTMEYIHIDASKFLKQAFIADVVALIHKTTNLLLTPPMKYSNPYYRSSKKYVLYHIYDSDSLKENSKFRFSEIKKQLETIPKLEKETISFEEKQLNLYACQWCMSALSSSLKTFTSVVMLKELTTRVHQYIDSKEMFYWLDYYENSRTHDIIGRYNGDQEPTIPIYLFDFSANEVLLFDRFHQSLSNSKMVVSVQTKIGHIYVDYSCNGEQRTVDSNDATRATLASLLETAYGIAPSYSLWDSAHKTAHVDHLWCIGRTPFGQLSTETELSFVYKDLAVRSTLYNLMNSTISDLETYFTTFQKYGQSIEDALSPQDYIEFLRRWNVFSFKLQKASFYLSLNKFDFAFYFLRSSRFDRLALTHLIFKAGKDFNSYWECGLEPIITPLALFSSSVFVFLVLVVICNLIGSLASSKRSKQA